MPEASLNTAGSLLAIGEEVIRAVADEELTPEQGKTILEITDAQRKNIETSDLANRIAELERTLRARK